MNLAFSSTSLLSVSTVWSHDFHTISLLVSVIHILHSQMQTSLQCSWYQHFHNFPHTRRWQNVSFSKWKHL